MFYLLLTDFDFKVAQKLKEEKEDKENRAENGAAESAGGVESPQVSASVPSPRHQSVHGPAVTNTQQTVV